MQVPEPMCRPQYLVFVMFPGQDMCGRVCTFLFSFVTDCFLLFLAFGREQTRARLRPIVLPNLFSLWYHAAKAAKCAKSDLINSELLFTCQCCAHARPFMT